MYSWMCIYICMCVCVCVCETCCFLDLHKNYQLSLQHPFGVDKHRAGNRGRKTCYESLTMPQLQNWCWNCMVLLSISIQGIWQDLSLSSSQWPWLMWQFLRILICQLSTFSWNLSLEKQSGPRSKISTNEMKRRWVLFLITHSTHPLSLPHTVKRKAGRVCMTK